tara:strand:+ start:566 stop:2092 length:1527 start_codon:yes stop_codon:yes gene_type:complete
MTTQTIETTIGSIPNPSNWLSAHIHDETPVIFLEKAVDGRTTIEDIKPALDEYKRLYAAGISSPAEILTLSRAYPQNEKYSKALAELDISNDDSLVIGGPASIEMVDREGHLITTEALTKAFKKYMANFRTRNAMVLHSDVQVGWALPAYISKGGQVFKSGVDDKGLFFITELRTDTKIAKKVVDQIHEGKLKSYSIAGSAIKTQTVKKGLQEIMQVDELELAEVTVCEKGVNQGASFDILKATDAATSSCIDGSCLIQKEEDCDCGCNTIQGVELMYKSEGEIDFTKSFLNFVGEPINKIVQDADGEYGESFSTLVDIQGRQAEHRRMLDQRGFPAELETDSPKRAAIEGGNSTEIPLVVFKGILAKAKEEKELQKFWPLAALGALAAVPAAAGLAVGSMLNSNKESSKNIKNKEKEDPQELQKFPLLPVVAGLVGAKILSSNKESARKTKSKKITKSQEFFSWVEKSDPMIRVPHLLKENCPCESCFQKNSDFRGTIEREANNSFA